MLVIISVFSLISLVCAWLVVTDVWPLTSKLLGINIHCDASCEILHTVLLGIDKYLWYETSNKWNAQREEEFASQLADLSTDGLTIHSFWLQYIVWFKNSLIGQHFKALQQLAIFPLYAKLGTSIEKERQLFVLWKATRELTLLLWFPETSNVDEYLVHILWSALSHLTIVYLFQVDVDTAVNNVLDAWGAFNPACIQYKYKLHVLSHLRENILHFRPPILYATETFKSWNGIFHNCSILSNHSSPSCDITETLAGVERVKHYTSSSWWKEQNAGSSYVCTGEGVRDCLSNNEDIQCHLGLHMKSAATGWASKDSCNFADVYHWPFWTLIGTVKPVVKRLQSAQILTTYTNNVPDAIHIDEGLSAVGKSYIECDHIVSESKDICKPLSWVFYNSQSISYHIHPPS